MEIEWQPLRTNGLVFITSLADEIQIYELPHDKTNKRTCECSEDSDQPGHPLSLHCLHEETLGP